MMNDLKKIVYLLLLLTAPCTMPEATDASATQTTITNDNLSATPRVESLYEKNNSNQKTLSPQPKEVGKVYKNQFAVLINDQDKTVLGYLVTNNVQDRLLGYTQATDNQGIITRTPQYGTAMQGKEFIEQLQATTKIILDSQMCYYPLQNIIHDEASDGYYILSHASTRVEYDSELSYLGNYQDEQGIIYFVYGEKVSQSRYNHIAKTIEHHEIINPENSGNSF